MRCLVSEKILRHRRNSSNWAKNNPEKVKKTNDNYRKNNKEKLKAFEATRSKNRIRFKGKYIRLDHNPRIGKCSKCGRTVKSGEIQKTYMHHDKYVKSNPLAHTRELCGRCHRNEHKKKEID